MRRKVGYATRVWLLVNSMMSVAFADMYDVLLPHYLPPAECVHGCAPWSSLPKHFAQLWAGIGPPPNASNYCAIPAAAVNEPDPGVRASNRCGGRGLGYLVCNGSTTSFYGPICACEKKNNSGDNTPHFATCTAPASYPEQINLQIAASDTIVASFVTFEEKIPVAPPVVQLRASGVQGGWPREITGVAHRYTTSHAEKSQFCDKSSPSSLPCLRRHYTMSFVRLAGLLPRTVYEYRVKSGR